MRDETNDINGIDVPELRGYIDSVMADSTAADRHPVVVARWAGGTGASVTSSLGGGTTVIGDGDAPSAMNMLLRTLAACDVEVVATTAALLGVEIDELEVEATGYFNIARLLGIDSDVEPGYQRIGYTIRLRTRNATDQQLAAIKAACLNNSPVGNTLERAVPVTLAFETA